MRTILCVACVCVVGQGCVTKTEYEALAAERDRAAAELTTDRTDATRRGATEVPDLSSLPGYTELRKLAGG